MLSICILTYNEERHLPRLLNQLSALGLGAEILVFDSFSTDKTEKIAKSYAGVRFIQNKFENFASQRNAWIDASLGDWILMLDADEILSEELAEELKAKTYETAGYDIYDIPRKNYFLGKWIRWTWPDPQRRLFKKLGSFRYSSNVHETVATKEPVGWLKGHIEHLTVGYWVAEWVRKMNSYTDKAIWNGEKMGVIKLLGKPFAHAAYYYFAKGGFRDWKVGLTYWVMVWMYSFIENMKKYEKSIESVPTEKI